MIRVVSFCICFLIVQVALSQQDKIDSLKKVLETATDEEKVDLHNEIALYYRSISFQEVKNHSIKSYNYARELKFHEKMISSLSNVAIAHVYLGNIDSAGMLFEKIYHIADSIGNQELRNNTLFNLGNFYYNTNKYDLALECFQEALPVYLNMQDTLHIARCQQNIGNIYFQNKDYEKALQAFYDAGSTFQSIGLQGEVDDLYTNRGMVFLKMKQYDSATICLEKGIGYAIRDGNQLNVMYNHNNLGLVYLEKGEYKKALQNFKKSIQISREMVYPYEEANCMLNIVQTYIGSMQYDSAMIILKEVYPLLQKVDNTELLRDYNEYAYKIYIERKDYKKALGFYTKYHALRDSILGKETIDRINELNIKFESAKKEAENQKLKTDVEIRKSREFQLYVLIGGIIILLIALVVFLILMRKNFLQKQKLSQKEAVLLNERLEHSKRELASKALHLACQNEFRAKMLETTNEVFDNLDENGKQSVKNLLKELENNIDKSAWQEFETRFEQVHETFFKELNKRYPDLTPNDRRICAFLKLNMSTKDIALLTHRSPRSVESARYRLRKKFNIDTDTDISTYLQTI